MIAWKQRVGNVYARGGFADVEILLCGDVLFEIEGVHVAEGAGHPALAADDAAHVVLGDVDLENDLAVVLELGDLDGVGVVDDLLEGVLEHAPRQDPGRARPAAPSPSPATSAPTTSASPSSAPR